MVKRATQRGYTLMEIVVTLAVFGVFLFIIVILTAEMRSQEKKYPINYMTHAEASAVVARMRRDVYDAIYLSPEYHQYKRSSKVIVMYCVRETTGETVVWDFRQKGDARRKTFVAEAMTSDWVAHGVPDFTVYNIEDNPEIEITATGQQPDVRLTANDDKGKTAIDQIFFKRPTIGT